MLPWHCRPLLRSMSLARQSHRCASQMEASGPSPWVISSSGSLDVYWPSALASNLGNSSWTPFRALYSLDVVFVEVPTCALGPSVPTCACRRPARVLKAKFPVSWLSWTFKTPSTRSPGLSLIRRQVAQHFPSLLGYFNARYGGATRLRLRSDNPDCAYILSREGVQQGDRLGPFFFSLALHAILPTQTNSSMTMANVDDVHVVGSPTDVASAVQHILSASRDLGAGLQLNVSKSRIWTGAIEEPAVRAAFSTHCPTLGDTMLPTCSPREGLMVLGVLFGQWQRDTASTMDPITRGGVSARDC